VPSVLPATIAGPQPRLQRPVPALPCYAGSTQCASTVAALQILGAGQDNGPGAPAAARWVREEPCDWAAINLCGENWG
jgi:hypothetical protein